MWSKEPILLLSRCRYNSADSRINPLIYVGIGQINCQQFVQPASNTKADTNAQIFSLKALSIVVTIVVLYTLSMQDFAIAFDLRCRNEILPEI